MSIFEIFTVKNTPTYVASKEVLEKLQEAKDACEEQECCSSCDDSKETEPEESDKTN